VYPQAVGGLQHPDCDTTEPKLFSSRKYNNNNNNKETTKVMESWQP
jgi:hypothetical protein